jgi:hypothetical protein
MGCRRVAQIDDDFPFEGSEPNTRTTFRPFAKAALAYLGLFCTQHVFTAAQQTYTQNIMERLDPHARIFATVASLSVCKEVVVS